MNAPPRGFLYLEALVATVLVAVSLVPAVQALQTAAMSAAQATVNGQPGLNLRAKAEEVLGRPYGVLDFAANRSLSSSTVAVTSPRTGYASLDPGPGYSDSNYLVYIYRYDGAALTASDTGLLRVRVVDRSNSSRFVDALVSR